MLHKNLLILSHWHLKRRSERWWYKSSCMRCNSLLLSDNDAKLEHTTESFFSCETCCNGAKLRRYSSFFYDINLPQWATLRQCLVKMHLVSNNLNTKPASCSTMWEHFRHNTGSQIHLKCHKRLLACTKISWLKAVNLMGQLSSQEKKMVDMRKMGNLTSLWH